MIVRKKFLQLTRFTTPYQKENSLKNYLPNDVESDDYGNYFYKIGDSSTMFVCHLDNYCNTVKKVNHVIDNNIIKTDGKTILGADDKAGLVILLYMIENKVPGLYYFFIGEEVGCIGSDKTSMEWYRSEIAKKISKVISFDRKGKTSVITEQLYGICCSDKFAKELSNRLNSTGHNLNFRPDNTGLITDSAQFAYIVPECTNISVGYENEHTLGEYQDIDFLSRLCKSVCSIDWETLPIERIPFL